MKIEELEYMIDKEQMNKLGTTGWDSVVEILICSQELSEATIRDDFEAYLKSRTETYPELNYYANNGTWRSTATTNPEQIKQIHNTLSEPEPNQCYFNAQTNLRTQTEYAEGYAVRKDGAFIVPHAWLEHRGVVVEITPSVDKQRMEYFGCTFPDSLVDEVLLDREHASPIVESERVLNQHG